MRNRIILAAIAVVVGVTAVAAIASAWSKKTAGTGATDASASISPHDITVKQGNVLPVEYWAHPF